jgi:hypothetical protein
VGLREEEVAWVEKAEVRAAREAAERLEEAAREAAVAWVAVRATVRWAGRLALVPDRATAEAAGSEAAPER